MNMRQLALYLSVAAAAVYLWSQFRALSNAARLPPGTPMHGMSCRCADVEATENQPSWTG